MVDHSDVVGALPVGAVPTTSSFSTPGFIRLHKDKLQDEMSNISVLGLGASFIRGFLVFFFYCHIILKKAIHKTLVPSNTIW